MGLFSRIIVVGTLVCATVLLEGCGNGSGQGSNLAPRVDIAPGGTGAVSLALADFNGDGKLDIAVSNHVTNAISVYLNQGGGRFGAAITSNVAIGGAVLPILNGPGKIVAGDVNEDGKPDLVVSGFLISANIVSIGSIGSFASIGSIGLPPIDPLAPQDEVVLLGNGDGTFTQSSPLPSSYGFFDAQLIDVNGDKHLDLVAGGAGAVSVVLGNGDGSFQPAATFGTDLFSPGVSLYRGIDAVDLHGDGNLEVVGAASVSPTLPGAAVVFPSNGDGTLQAPITSPISAAPDSLAAANFNADGNFDLLIGFAGSASAGLGNLDNTFDLIAPNEQVAYSTNPPDLGRTIVRAADMDQDGKPDALVTDFNAGTLTIAQNDGTGFSAAAKQYTYMVEPGLTDMAVGDLNGDDLPDVVLLNGLNNTVSLFLSKR